LDDDRLPTDLWVMGHLRRCNDEAVPAMVVRKGEAKGGTLLLKVNGSVRAKLLEGRMQVS
jgi:hypothetical protein